MPEKPTKEAFTFYKLDTYILNHFGVEAAGVHGVIRNKSQTPGYVCELSQQTIGNILHMSYKRVGDAIDILLENGFITPAKGKTNLRTNAYQCDLEKCDIPLTSENTISLKCNDERVRKHEEGKKAYEAKKLNQPDDVHDINKLDDTNHINKVDDTNCINEMDNDGMFRPNKPSVVDTNHPPIKNYSKEINNKKIDVVSSFFTKDENDVKNYLEEKLDYKFAEQDKWKAIFNYILDMHNKKKPIQDFVIHIRDTGFDMKFMTLERLKEIYANDIQTDDWDDPKKWIGWLPDFKTVKEYHDYYQPNEEKKKQSDNLWSEFRRKRAMEKFK